ncbi:hypothetical protein FXV77_05570 [Sphingobacterium phlebotomi]|uniref:Outer membrane protein beta-barrel domain-containing protein n=1 Tax=Sphingobacterium phlebotomi TaxID=2605433 RepID=A0A5D4HA39_9SPHI|nr:hypothetical protein [Sphingobacterium phlebotomi]TYR37474.1 hypothetical protein FXV77_05570 [Sphingobacterium phlebotomi]
MMSYYKLILFSLITVLLFATKLAFSQKKIDWYATAGLGITSMRNFSSRIADLDFSTYAGDAYIAYRVKENPNYMVSAGIGVSGDFNEDGIFGWDAGLNLRSAGFSLTANLQESKGELPDFLQESLPEFGKTKSFQYLSLHVPISINYNPFKVVGLTFGADIYFQTTDRLTEREYPYGQIGRSLGFSHSYKPEYRHPFQVGGHVGIFAPLGKKVRIDITLNSDIVSRLNVSYSNPAVSDWKFRELGLALNARYYLDW